MSIPRELDKSRPRGFFSWEGVQTQEALLWKTTFRRSNGLESARGGSNPFNLFRSSLGNYAKFSLSGREDSSSPDAG